MYKAGVCICYSRLDLFIIKQWPSLPLVPEPSMQGRKWPGRAFTGIRRTRNYTCWLPESFLLQVEPWCSVSHWLSLMSLKRALLGTNCFSFLCRESMRLCFCGKSMIADLLKIASHMTGHQTFHPHTFEHRQANETRATLGRRGQDKFAKCQRAALHSDTLTSVKYIKYWVAVRPMAQFIHIMRLNDRDMDW